MFNRKKTPEPVKLKPGEYFTLSDYYEKQYPIDLEEFKKACPFDKNTTDLTKKAFIPADLQDLRKSDYPLLKKKHFLYFLALHTALLMEVYKHFYNNYDEFKERNKGMIFEYGCSNVYLYPWDILRALRVSFDKDLFWACFREVFTKLRTDDNFCGINEEDFMEIFINDPDMNNEKYSYGKSWKKMCQIEWDEIVLSSIPRYHARSSE